MFYTSVRPCCPLPATMPPPPPPPPGHSGRGRSCCFCGPVRNCAPYIDRVLDNVEKLMAALHACGGGDNSELILFYDASTDDTLARLRRRQRANPRIKVLVNRAPLAAHRTHRIAHARNACLDYVRAHRDRFPLFAMMDFDDPNAKSVHPEVLTAGLARDDWDGLSFQTTPAYYDIWALSLYPFCFSYNHFRQSRTNSYAALQAYVERRLARLTPGELLPCTSAFNGFAVYRTAVYADSRYDGRVRLDLIHPAGIAAHAAIAGGRGGVIFPHYGHVDARHEDCEHRAFHHHPSVRTARLRISPRVLFG